MMGYYDYYDHEEDKLKLELERLLCKARKRKLREDIDALKRAEDNKFHGV